MHRVSALILLCMATPTLAAAPATPAWNAAAVNSEATGVLKDLIRLDSRDPPGNESVVANYLAAIFRREGIAYELLEPVPGRASIVARLKGDGSKRPLLLMGHEDVVPVDAARWSVEPFAAIERDGSIYGRGASDDKASVAANLEVFLELKRQKVRLARDVIFLAEASEEASSPAGMEVLVERYWDRIACEFALNEGGTPKVVDGEVIYMAVGTAEKMPRGVQLVATGSSGHGSVPRLDNAVTHLAAAVAAAGNWEPPARLNDTTREFFRRLASVAPAGERAWYADVLAPANQAELRRHQPVYYSMLRTSVVPTMLAAGLKSNVIPPTAAATLDIRALPGEDLPAFYAELARVINDPQVKLVPADLQYQMPASQPSSLTTEMFAALEYAQRTVVPRAQTLPTMGTGATDSSFLRTKGVQAYGISVPKTDAETASVHGNDEHVEVAQFELFLRYLWTAVTRVAGR